MKLCIFTLHRILETVGRRNSMKMCPLFSVLRLGFDCTYENATTFGQNDLYVTPINLAASHVPDVVAVNKIRDDCSTLSLSMGISLNFSASDLVWSNMMFRLDKFSSSTATSSERFSYLLKICSSHKQIFVCSSAKCCMTVGQSLLESIKQLMPLAFSILQ